MKVYKGRSGESSKKELKQNSALRTEVFRFFFILQLFRDKQNFKKLEVVSEQLLYFYIAYKDMPYIQSQAIEVKESTQENKSKHIFENICLQMRTYVLK